GLLELRWADVPQQPKAVGLGDNAASGIGENSVAICVIAVMVSIEDVADRLVSCLLNRFDDFGSTLGKIGVDDGDIVVEYDPDIVAAAENDALIRRADGRVAEKDAGSDFLHLVELHW